MNKALYVFLVILALGTSIILSIMESTSYVYYDAREVYRVYLNGDSIGIIENKKDLEDYINNMQQRIKQKYNVKNVYIPNGLNIKEETTYNEKTESIESIYSKISEQEDFTINGYTVTITDEKITYKDNDKNSESTKIKEYLYITNKKIFTEAVNDVVRSFVNEEQYNNYLNEIKNSNQRGTTIDNVYIKDKISIKKGRIPVNETIYQTEADLAQYLLFGTNEKNKIYKVKSGDTIKKIANDNEMSTDEFLIANKDITDENALLYKGQEVIISWINPVITVVEESSSVKKESIRYKTIEKYDKSMMPGHYTVIRKGQKGQSLITRKIKKQNGKIVTALIVNKEVITEPISRVIKTGGSVYWVWPTSRNYTISTYFGYQLRSDIGETSSRMHDGIDISGLGCNTPIYAANDGTVSFAGWYTGYGQAIEITHADGYKSLYGHLNRIYVSNGQTVRKGQQIGLMGNTGYSFGCHLHFKTTKSGTLFNPLSLY